MTSSFNEKTEKLDNPNIVKIIYLPKFAIKLALISFDKYKNKLKNRRLP